MALVYEGPHPASISGATGNNTHSSVHIGADYSTVALQFVVEAIGSTPTITYTWQGSPDNVNWYPIAYITDASDTLSVAATVATTVSAALQFICNGSIRRYKYIRLVTSSNTNVTYRGEIYLAD
jgi:hypothetical protein